MKTSLFMIGGASLVLTLAALAASTTASAASRDLMSCRGTRGQVIDCCEKVRRKPLWFRTSDMSCHDVVICSPKKGKPSCYVRIVHEDRPNEPHNTPSTPGDGGGNDTPDTSVPR